MDLSRLHSICQLVTMVHPHPTSFLLPSSTAGPDLGWGEASGQSLWPLPLADQQTKGCLVCVLWVL